jgi:hypothetical protein
MSHFACVLSMGRPICVISSKKQKQTSALHLSWHVKNNEHMSMIALTACGRLSLALYVLLGHELVTKSLGGLATYKSSLTSQQLPVARQRSTKDPQNWWGASSSHSQAFLFPHSITRNL